MKTQSMIEKIREATPLINYLARFKLERNRIQDTTTHDAKDAPNRMTQNMTPIALKYDPMKDDRKKDDQKCG
eukprot:596013-Amphidinium_carterae.1